MLERSVRLRVSAAALRSVEHRGGLDDFLVKAHEFELSEDAVKLKREIAKKRAEDQGRAAAARSRLKVGVIGRHSRWRDDGLAAARLSSAASRDRASTAR